MVDVSTQSDLEMSMKEWTNYYEGGLVVVVVVAVACCCFLHSM